MEGSEPSRSGRARTLAFERAKTRRTASSRSASHPAPSPRRGVVFVDPTLGISKSKATVLRGDFEALVPEFGQYARKNGSTTAGTSAPHRDLDDPMRSSTTACGCCSRKPSAAFSTERGSETESLPHRWHRQRTARAKVQRPMPLGSEHRSAPPFGPARPRWAGRPPEPPQPSGGIRRSPSHCPGYACGLYESV